ncbi:fimbrial chaperone protein [Photobacterium kishitanii]|uniref:fimbrial chaperone n=1 Tax=Photobacterium kishitanii TaxID=318456 RepID=UPI0005D33D19|nr:fimbrial chaperone [Photobacterium kishitanii]KJG09539.1 fimbrial chaperone protein [Photobacterium kishitanii]PSV07891.1 fimbrial chaperone protein [Photobacterium kishitanii]PSV71428.1 fimbrial chaperone protein [Photobacterium kishitanii]
MNKYKKKILVTLLALGVSHQAMAAFVLDGTRFIYNEGDKSIPVRVTNNADTLYGGQVWIDNSNQSKDDVYMVPSPPFFRVEAKQQQIIRLMNVNKTLPQQQESLFFLNVMEVPPKAKKEDGNVLAFAMNTKVKLIYRPSDLKKGRLDAEKSVKIERKDDKTFVVNPTPYYFAIVNIKVNGKKVALTSQQSNEIATFKPFSEVRIPSFPVGKATFDAINDWGGPQTFSF